MENIVNRMWDKVLTEDFKSGLISLDVFLDGLRPQILNIDTSRSGEILNLNVNQYTDLSDVIEDIHLYHEFIVPLCADEINTSEGTSLMPILIYAQTFFDEEVIYDDIKKEFFYAD